MADLTVKFLGDVSGLAKATKSAESTVKGFGSKVGALAQKVTLAVGAAGTAAAGFALKSGADLQESQDKLSVALKNAGTSWKAHADQITNAVKVNEKFGTTAAETTDLLAKGVTSTGSYSKAVKILSLAQNVSVASGKDLASSYLAVTKASEGQLRPLKQLGIDLPIAAGGALKVKKASEALVAAQAKQKQVQAAINSGLLKGPAALKALASANALVATDQKKLNAVQASGTGILDALAKKTKGQASAAAESFRGKMKALHAQMTDLAAGIGLKLIPVIEKLVGWFTRHKGVAVALVAVVGTLTAALVAYNIIQKTIVVATAAWSAATKIATAVQWAFNVALEANPIGLVVAAIAALVIGLVVAYKKVGWFHDAVNAAFHAIQKVVEVVVGFIRDHWKLLFAILVGPVGLAIVWIVKHWDTISDKVAAVVSFIGDHWKLIVGLLIGPVALAVAVIVNNWNTITGVFSAVVGFIGKVWSGITAVLINPVLFAIAIIRNAVGTIVGFFKNLPGEFVKIGQAILEGILQGIGDLGSAIWEHIKGGLGGLVGKVKGFFGIHSPSTVFYGIGKNITVGLAQGIQAGTTAAEDAIKSLAQSLIGSMQQFADPTNLFGTKGVTGKGIAQFLGNRANDIAHFIRVVRALAKRGLNQTTLSELIAAGPSATPGADALLHASTKTFKQVNRAQQEIGTQMARGVGLAAIPFGNTGGATYATTIYVTTLDPMAAGDYIAKVLQKYNNTKGPLNIKVA